MPRACLLLGFLACATAQAEAVSAGPFFSKNSPLSPRRFAGLSLDEALSALRARGVRLVYSSRVVRPEMRVENEPAGVDPRAVLDGLLAEHGLVAREGPHGLLVIVARPGGAPPPPEAEGQAGEPMPTFHEEIVVTPSRFSLLGTGPASRVGLSREEILALPHLGDDLARALTVAPGIAGNDVSARFHVRGGRRDETALLLDGQELLDPFHLRDFDGALSIVPPAILSGAELSTGTFSANHGGSLSGVLDMTSLTPAGAASARLGAGILGAQIGGAGALPRERGGWLIEGRRGTGDLLGKLLKIENPEYWDVFGKIEVTLTPRHNLRANVLRASDRLTFSEVEDGDPKRWRTGYDDSYIWLTHQALLGSAVLAESAGSSTRVRRDRRGDEVDEDARFSIRDLRDTAVLELRQGWSFQAGGRHEIRAGWQLRDAATEYDYSGARQLESPLARLRHDFGREPLPFAGRFRARDAALFLSDAIRLQEALTLELGLRYDRRPLTGDPPWSPRLNLAYALGEGAVLRLGWGIFRQSQRTFELQIEDGETAFHRGERSEQRVLGFDRTFTGHGRFRPRDLRLEIYQRRITHPRPRYENLFEPLNVFPEIEPDRVRVAPESSRARGLEVFLRAALGERAGAWINYTLSETTDRLAGRDVPRLFDQRHAVNLNFDLPAGPHWRLNLVWRYHTGWRTTPLSLRAEEDEEGETEFVPVLGPVNSRRLPPYHRLDLRASRRVQLRRGSLELFVDAQNLYNRHNIGGFDHQIDEERGTLERRKEPWPGLLPSLGLTLQF